MRLQPQQTPPASATWHEMLPFCGILPGDGHPAHLTSWPSPLAPCHPSTLHQSHSLPTHPPQYSTHIWHRVILFVLLIILQIRGWQTRAPRPDSTCGLFLYGPCATNSFLKKKEKKKKPLTPRRPQNSLYRQTFYQFEEESPRWSIRLVHCCDLSLAYSRCSINISWMNEWTDITFKWKQNIQVIRISHRLPVVQPTCRPRLYN